MKVDDTLNLFPIVTRIYYVLVALYQQFKVFRSIEILYAFRVRG